MREKRFDAVGIGLNSADLLCVVERHPLFNTKGPLLEVSRQGGGQAATAMAALARLGLRTAYIGAVGDDEEGKFSLQSLRAEGVDVEGVAVQPGRASQFAIILGHPRWDRQSYSAACGRASTRAESRIPLKVPKEAKPSGNAVPGS